MLLRSYCQAANSSCRGLFRPGTPRIVVFFSTRPDHGNEATRVVTLRNMIKPFLLKCHPDVQRSESAKKTNLLAIQNLNAYIDAVDSLLPKTNKVSVRESSTRLFPVDFVISLSDSENTDVKILLKKRKESAITTSRRKVELVLPPRPGTHDAVQRHAAGQIVRLLQMAGLQVPADHDIYNDDANTNDQQQQQQHDPWQGAWNDEFGLDQEDDPIRPHHANDDERQGRRSSPSSVYQENRERFTASINWTKYNQIYRQAMSDLEADLATSGLVDDNVGRRRTVIANLLATTRLEEETTPLLDQAVAFRRLSLLLDQHFEALHMEKFGRLWENCNLVLTPARSYNTNATALHKRRQRHDPDGFAFTLHPDFAVTVHIPIDFRDDELVQELDRNLWDIYDIIEDGFEGLFYNKY
jgi:hypothetical protein